jgi:hypothetical protein
MTPLTTAPSVLIRAARGSDGAALRNLAALDSSAVPAGRLLIAETDGDLVAALDQESGAHIADPFRPTADVVALLQLRSDRKDVARRRGLAERLGLRLAPRTSTA